MDITPNIRLDEALTATAGVYFDATTLLARVESPYQTIEIYDTHDVGRLMRIDGVNMTSERDEFFYHENLIHPAAIAHPTPKTALIIGGGDGGAAEELLKHPSITHCDLCELDGEVITLAKQYLQAVHHGVFGDPRLHVSIDDGVRFLQNSTINYDLIYLDLTDPVGEAAALYTVDFYSACSAKLTNGGALTIHIGSPFMHPERVNVAIGRLGAVFQHVTPYFGHIPIYGATWGFAVASDVIDIAVIDAATVNSQLQARSINQRQFYNGEMHVAMQALPEYVKTLLNTCHACKSDAN
jgi:spermidine synthase